MSNPTDKGRDRIRRIAFASKTGRLKEEFPNFSVTDVALLVGRLDELELDDSADAEPLMRWALARLKEDRAQKAAWLEDALENVRMAELCLNEAIEAERAVEALIGDTLFRNGERINAQWDQVMAGYYAAGLLPPVPEAPEQNAADAPAPGEPPADPEPESTAPAGPSPVEADAAGLARSPEIETAALTEKQRTMFDALVSVADADWRATISHGRLKALTGISLGSVSQILWALELKDHVRALERGNAKTPATYLICEGVRPARATAPKTDAELIAEAVAAGRVTKVPAPGSPKVH